MSPILDSIGSVKAYGWGKVLALTSFESIATVSVGSGGAANVEFTSIPATYAHLQIRALARTDRANAGDAVYVRFNNDSGSTYSGHRLEGNGSSASAQFETSSTSFTLNRITAANNGASQFGVFVFDLLDYKDTNKYSTARALVGFDGNGSGLIGLDSGSWRNTAAVDRIDILPLNASGFVQYSHFALYGIKGA